MYIHILAKHIAFNKYYLINALLIGVFITTPIVLGQNSNIPTIELLDATELRSVAVNIIIRSGDREVMIPICNEYKTIMKAICSNAYVVEIKINNKWQPAKAYEGIVLGGLPNEKWKHATIPARKTDGFTIRFSKEIYDVHSSQTLRVIVDAYPDEKSMRAGKDPIKLVAKEFKCP